jgi:Ca2+-binding RTX toxin-like protein
MKRFLPIAITALAAVTATSAPAAEGAFNVLLTGGPEQNVIDVKVSTDGRSYILDSVFGPLEAPPGVCQHREGSENGLICEAAKIASFEVNAGGGDDSVNISPKVPVPVTLRGGPGNDRLRGGNADDKLVGGAGDDSLSGNGGNDVLYGGEGDDWLYGQAGNDRLFGWSGDDFLRGGSGENVVVGGAGTNDLG